MSDYQQQFDQAMNDLNDMYQDQPTEAELDSMYIDHISKKIDHGKFNYTMNDWLEINDAIGAMGRLQHKQDDIPYSLLKDSTATFTSVMRKVGYEPINMESVEMFVNRNGEYAAKREGRDWASEKKGDYNYRRGDKVHDIHQLGFAEMIPFRAANKQAWKDSDSRMLNDSIVNDIKKADAHYAEEMEYYQSKRGKGDDATIDRFEQNVADVNKMTKEGVYSEVYHLENLNPNTLPPSVKPGLGDCKNLIEPRTFKVLGPDYNHYRCDLIRKYSDERLQHFENQEKGILIDFTHSGASSLHQAVPVNDRTAMYQDFLKNHVEKNTVSMGSRIRYDKSVEHTKDGGKEVEAPSRKSVVKQDVKHTAKRVIQLPSHSYDSEFDGPEPGVDAF